MTDVRKSIQKIRIGDVEYADVFAVIKAISDERELMLGWLDEQILADLAARRRRVLASDLERRRRPRRFRRPRDRTAPAAHFGRDRVRRGRAVDGIRELGRPTRGPAPYVRGRPKLLRRRVPHRQI